MFRLFTDSNNGIDVMPEYDMLNRARKIENRFRSKSGREYVYKFGEYNRFQFGVMFVDSSFKFTVNTWWSSNADLLFMEESGTQIFSVHITNRDQPVGGFIRPYTDLFKGKLELETY